MPVANQWLIRSGSLQSESLKSASPVEQFGGNFLKKPLVQLKHLPLFWRLWEETLQALASQMSVTFAETIVNHTVHSRHGINRKQLHDRLTKASLLPHKHCTKPDPYIGVLVRISSFDG